MPDESVAYARVALDPPFDLMHARYARQTFVPHAHAEYVVGVIESGIGELRHASGCERHPAGDIFVISPGLIHTGRSASAEGWSYRAMYLPAAWLERAARRALGDAAPRFERTAVHDPLLAGRLVDIHRVLMADPVATASSAAALASALEHLVRAHANPRPDVAAGDPRVSASLRATREFLDREFLRPITIDDLAQRAGLSPTYLIRAFHRTFGLPPYVYVEQLRVRHARALIEAGTPLSAAALLAGFSDQSHLTRRFRRTFGITPGAFASRVRMPEALRGRIVQARSTRQHYTRG